MGPEDESKEFGTEEKCPNNEAGHEPDWKSVSVEMDGEQAYVDVACMHCGRSGCVGSVKFLLENLSW